MCFTILAPGTTAFGFQQELVKNGDFERDWRQEWEKYVVGYEPDAITRRDDFHPDSDYEIRVFKDSQKTKSSASLFQIVELPSLDVDFSVFARLFPRVNEGKNDENGWEKWAVASVIIKYLDASEDSLGETRYYRKTRYSDWGEDSDTIHHYEFPDTTDWHRRSYNILDELTDYLPGIDTSLVKKVKIELFSSLPGSGAC